jgi:hypothetical protein
MMINNGLLIVDGQTIAVAHIASVSEPQFRKRSPLNIAMLTMFGICTLMGGIGVLFLIWAIYEAKKPVGWFFDVRGQGPGGQPKHRIVNQDRAVIDQLRHQILNAMQQAA